MGILKKVYVIGGKSKGITLPKSWLELIERRVGYEITEVEIEIDGELRIKPILKAEVVAQ